ncbi:5-demethoxyubiquinone hydroxylase, mitochondrial [Strongylocentrotus purpuratus]|uniref:5-demethoxyubiquinone hydroxylase, mitochondrial n=1 Tax=Strongylocentrotus purpuratus TaxID=7668 RepID=A0A7M7NQH7_STRPU|nr:5-demethoxyubiquinone hydroxylase, mitochondrial [Strongylocentrotus purpuratus]
MQNLTSIRYCVLRQYKLRMSRAIVEVKGQRSASSLSGLTRREMIDRFIRVDHAGEVGADRIYAGQLAVLKNTSVGPLIQEMWDQEKHHKETFERLIPERRVRPTVLLPIWNVAGYVLGAGTALMGKEAAMACTVAVEESIGQHYNDQIRALIEDDPEVHKELLEIIKQFRDEELEHLNTGLENDAKKAPMYSTMDMVIKGGCKAAIWLSERI